MAEEIVITNGEKSKIYEDLLPQIKALVGNETDSVAILANVSAAIMQTFDFLWVGFYLVQDDELVLGPFQGPVACTRIKYGAGVCGSSWEQKNTLMVDDVDSFPGHIACSSLSKSEIVVPLFKNDDVIGVLDIDSDELATFDSIDKKYLNSLCKWLSTVL